MIYKGTIKAVDRENYLATVQIDGSLSVWLSAVPISHALSPEDLPIGTSCSVLMHDPSNPDDSVVIGPWGSPRHIPHMDGRDWKVIDDFTHWTASTSGGGTTARAFRTAYLTTTGVTVSGANIYHQWHPGITWANPFIITWVVKMATKFGSGNYNWIYIGINNGHAQPNGRCIGFRWDDYALKGMHYGTSLNITDLSTTIDAWVHFYTVTFDSSTIRWYYDNALVGESTTDLPPSANTTAYINFAGLSPGGGLCGTVTRCSRWAYAHTIETGI